MSHTLSWRQTSNSSRSSKAPPNSTSYRNKGPAAYKNQKANSPQTREFPIKNWVTHHVETMTFDSLTKFLTENKVEEEQRFFMIMKMIGYLNFNIMNVLEEMATNKLISKRQIQNVNAYGYFHKAAYISSGCDLEIYERLVKMLYSCGFNPFTTNNKTDHDQNHETALMGLYQNNNDLNSEERNARYKIFIINMPTDMIPKILRSYLNKIVFDDSNSSNTTYLNNVIDIAKCFICLDAKMTMEILANYILVNEYKDTDFKLGTFCNVIDSRVKFIIDILAGSDNNFKNSQILDKSVAPFFKLGYAKCPSTNKLLNIFYRKTQDIVINSVNENKNRNDIAFVRMMGSFCSEQFFVKECNIQLKHFFEMDNVDNIIHMICHIGSVTSSFKKMLYDLTKNNVKFNVILEGMFNNNKNNVYNFKNVCIKKNDEHHIYDNIGNEVIEHEDDPIIKSLNVSIGSLEKDLIKKVDRVCKIHPKETIVKQIIIVILENTISHTQPKIPNIIKELIQNDFLNENVILEEEYYIMNMIKSNKLNCSTKLCYETWKIILASL